MLAAVLENFTGFASWDSNGYSLALKQLTPLMLQGSRMQSAVCNCFLLPSLAFSLPKYNAFCYRSEQSWGATFVWPMSECSRGGPPQDKVLFVNTLCPQ